MHTSTSTAPVGGARLARALTYLVYAFVLVAIVVLLPVDGRSVVDVSILFAIVVYGLAALLLHALIDWLTDRIAEVGYAG
jgi:uncharacterized protein YhhL (DUF1145 family)